MIEYIFGLSTYSVLSELCPVVQLQSILCRTGTVEQVTYSFGHQQGGKSDGSDDHDEDHREHGALLFREGKDTAATSAFARLPSI